jgi:hypothetical protein
MRGIPEWINERKFCKQFGPIYLQGMLRERIVFPHNFNRIMDSLGIDTARYNPSYSQMMKRIQFYMMLAEVHPTSMTRLALACHNVFNEGINSARVSQLAPEVITLICIGTGTGEFCKHCLRLAPTDMDHGCGAKINVMASYPIAMVNNVPQCTLCLAIGVPG